MKRKATIIILEIIILIMVLGSIGLCKSWERKNAQDTLQILIVGDSISEGAGASDPAFNGINIWRHMLKNSMEKS